MKRIFLFKDKSLKKFFKLPLLFHIYPLRIQTHSPACLVTYCLFSLVLYSTSVFSANSPEIKKLETLKQQIQQLQLELKSENKEKDQAVYLLQQAEQEVASASHKLYQTEKNFNTTQRKLTALQQEEKQLGNQLSRNREYLINQIRAAYGIGKQEYVKLLFNQEDPASISRMVVYYQYFNKARTDKIDQIDTRLTRLQIIKNNIKLQSERLDKLRKEALSEQEILKSRKRDRSKVVASLNASLNEKSHRLKNLLRDEQHLKKLLQEIETQLQDVNLDLSPPKKFRQLKGELSWPTSGVIGARFGSLRNNSGSLKWKGVVIDTKPGNTIKAVAYGRVVFADWLRGFGMLLIIDHGDGYMSLYGHNEQLHKNLGDWVQANEVIATSGNSGGQLATSLYFEIRYKGKPQDPVKWCKSLPERS